MVLSQMQDIIYGTISNDSRELNMFLEWLFSRKTQKEMPGGRRTFRRHTAKYWNIWPMPPKSEVRRNVLYLDGIYLGRKVCVLICCDDRNVTGLVSLQI